MENLENLTIISEDISKREKAVKHFSLSDGSMLAVVYPEDINPPGSINIDASKMEDAYINSIKPDDNFNESEFIKVGKDADGGIYSSFLKFTGLPKLNKGEMIIEAKLRLFTPSDKIPAQGKCIKLKQIIESWNQNEITFNNEPNTQDFVQDLQISDGQNNQFTWDITKVLREWYKLSDVNQNYGVKLYMDEADTGDLVEFVSADIDTNPEYNSIRPRILVRYKNYVGEEPYWSYSRHSAGVHGIGMVNNCSGNLVIREDLILSSGLRLPISIQNIYNSLNYNEYCNSSVYKNVYKDGYINSSPSGLGWRLDFNQLLFPIAADDKMNSENKYKFVFVDADGTQHYFIEVFNEDTEKYELFDEDGLVFELIVESDDVQKITDKKGNTMVFERTIDCSVLKKVIDNKNNSVIFSYDWVPSSDGNSKQYKISKITDPAGRKVEINYQPDGLMSSIIDVDGRGTYLQYDGKCLIGVTYCDGLKTAYEYDQKGRLCGVSSSVGTGSYIKYTYLSDDEESPNFTKISKVTEYGSLASSSENEGYSLEFSYNTNNTTTIKQTNPSTDVPYKEISQIFTFDNSGSTVSVLNDDGSAGTCAYHQESSTADKAKNKIIQNSSQKHFVNNLLLNHSAEDGMNNWTVKDAPESETAADNGAVIVDSSEHKIGENSFKVSQNSESPTEPCAVQKVSIPTVGENEYYTFSAYVKQNNSEISQATAQIFITPFVGTEKLSEAFCSKIIKLQNSEWKKAFVTLQVPENCDALEVGFGLTQANATVYFDCLQLEKGNVANDYNLLENSGFDKGISYWSTSGFSENDGIVDGKLRINGDILVCKSVSQTVKINMKNPVFCVNAKAEAQSLPFYERNGNTPKFGVTLDFLYDDDTTSKKTVNFNPEVSTEQLISACVSSYDRSPEITESKFVKSVTVLLEYNYNENTAFFDNIQLSLDDGGKRYSYDENGNIVSMKDSSDNKTSIEMTESNEISSVTSPKEYTSTIDYSSKNPHIPIKSTEPLPSGQLMTAYEYDKFHNIIKATASSNNESGKTIEQNFSYTPDGNYPKSTTDVFGNTIQYSCNERNGNLESLTDAAGNTVNYKYDRAGRLIKTKNNAYESGIKYKNGVVSSVYHNNDEQSNVVYNFSYDNFGNINKICVGNQTLSENTYDNHNGLLKKSTYGNGDSVLYNYDKYERLIGKTYNKSQETTDDYTYLYNSNNLLFEINDKYHSETVNFEYDTADRLTKKAFNNGTEIAYKYDESNILNERSLNSEAVSFNTTDDFKQQGLLTNSQTNINVVEINRDLWYDNLGRLESIQSVQTDLSQGGIRHKFAYVDVLNSNKTSTLIKSVTCEKSTSTDSWEGLGISYSYEYDANYNITKTFENSIEKISYIYDEQNQLIRENNALIGKTITYEYDFGGNILSKKEYAYSTEALGEVLNEITYGYADENWKDKLTSFNGETFTYDAIGNPLTYRDGLSIEWTSGRRLKEITKLGLNISFEYGFDGIRRKKTVNGETTEFITGGITILAQKTGDKVLAFLTDGNGDTYGFTFNGTPYFYLKNVQGDIIGIADTAGNIKAKYTYDSWGKLISITDSEGTDVTENPEHIGYINPLRYRGYYYDSETGLYYLNARYYDPGTGRFINADDESFIFEDNLNLFSYCGNDPVNGYDPYGMYDRKAAHLYAITWWEKPNPKYPNFGNNGDCANFVSQCLSAGGFKQNSDWYCFYSPNSGLNIQRIIRPYKNWIYSKAWSCAYEQYKYFKNSGLTYDEIVINSVNEIAPVASGEKGRVRIGDIMYMQWDKPYPHHAAIITSLRDGMIYYNAHTIPRDDEPLENFFSSNSNGKVYILRIK